jgi:hypothetical protein
VVESGEGAEARHRIPMADETPFARQPKFALDPPRGTGGKVCPATHEVGQTQRLPRLVLMRVNFEGLWDLPRAHWKANRKYDKQ